MAVHDAGDRSATIAAVAKADQSPVTQADIEADAVIVSGLMAAFPDIPVVTEERPETHRALSAAHFLVDPLDGTKEFIRRSGDFTVNIALIARGAPIVGVVYAPAAGRLFRTEAGGGAVEERAPFVAAPRPICVARADNDALRVVASRSHRDATTDAYIARYRPATLTTAGSSLKFCLIATGEADLYPRLGQTMEWDTAAGDAVLRAAGGAVSRLDGAGPLSYGKADRANPWFVAHGPGVRLIPPPPGGG